MSETLPMMPVSAGDYADICDTVRKICEGFPGAYWRELDDLPAGSGYPERFVVALGEAGIMSAAVPEEFGGVGLPLAALAAITSTINELGCNSATFVAQAHLIELISRYGNEAQKSNILPKLAANEVRLQALATLDEGARNDTEGFTSVATEGSASFRLSGKRSRVRFAINSDYIVVLAHCGETAGSDLLLIEPARFKQVEIEISSFEEMNNDCAAVLSFNQLTVGADAVIGEAGNGAKHLDDISAYQRVLDAAAAIGDGRFFSHRGVAYANERVVFGNLIGKYQGIQFPLAKAQVEIEAADVSMRKAAILYDNEADATGAALVARHLAIESGWAMADAAFTTFGGFAFAREYDIERKWRDVRASRVSAVSFKTDLIRLAEIELGLPRSD